MKRDFKLFALLLSTLLVYSLVIPATDARIGLASFPRSHSQSFDVVTGRSGAGARLTARAGNQDVKPVSGQLMQQERQDPELSKALRAYDLIKLEPHAAAMQIRDTGKLLIKTSRGDFDMELAPNDLRSSDYVAQVIDADGVAHKLARMPVNTYKGIVHGSKGAQARLTVKEGSVEGAIITEGERYFIQPARALSKNRNEDEFVFYKGSDVAKEAGSCGVTLAEEVAARETRISTEGKADITAEAVSPVPGLSPLKIARIATEADAEYVSALGGAAQANAQIMSIMNQVDGIYQVEIGITFQIVFQNAWADATVPGYPYPASLTAPSPLLSAFRNHWNSNFTNVQRSLAHMWTGKDMNEGTIGIASVGVVCRTPQSAYGVSQNFSGGGAPPNSITAQTVVLTTHEIGHNFSAAHTDEPDEDVPFDIEQPCGETIMEASIGSGSSFCPFSRSQIVGHANAYADCLIDSSVPAPSPSCVETSIEPGLLANGSLTTSDCPAPSRGVRHFADRYSFNGTRGEQMTVSMRKTSGDLDPYLYLIGPDGYVVAQDDDGEGSQNALIPSGGEFTLPLAGKYIIEATSFEPAQTGNYTVTVTKANCTLGVSPSSQHFPSSGGSGVINVTTTGLCINYRFSDYPNVSWLPQPSTVFSGPQALNFSVEANPNAAGRRAFLIVGGFNNFGGLRIPITQSGTGPDCSLTPIAFGQTIGANVSTSDCQSPVRGNGFYTDRYVFDAFAGQQIAITLSSFGVDAFLTLIGPNGVVLLTDDDSGGGTNSRIPGGTGSLTLGLPGAYTIDVGTFESGQTGPYTLTLTTIAPPATNPLENRDFFVNQHYRDFLDRGADAGGLSYWTGQLVECGTDADCIRRRRVGVSAAFFVELEFQRTGYVVYRMYRAAYGTLPNTTTRANITFAQFIADRALLPEGSDVAQTTISFANAFVQRSEFLTAYPANLTNAQFVNKLFDTAGLTPYTTERQQQSDAMTNNGKTRAQVLLDVIEIAEFKTREFNRSFVLMQYFGYLRRDPDQGGYDFWLSIVNNPTVSNYQSMVCAFLTSREYQERFSTIVPRSDSECANIN